jgi:hypothetical protein
MWYWLVGHATQLREKHRIKNLLSGAKELRNDTEKMPDGILSTEFPTSETPHYQGD